jgi:hypothetical protein
VSPIALADGTPSTTQPTIPPKQTALTAYAAPAATQPQPPSSSFPNTGLTPAQAGQASQTGGPSGSTGPSLVQQITAQLDQQFGGTMGSQDALNQWLSSLDQSQLAQIGAQFGLGQTQLQENAANQQALLGISGSDLAIQQGALARQQGLLPQLENLTQQGFGITQQGIDLQNWMNHFNAGNERTSQLGNAAASGATNTVGNVRNLKNIQDVLGYENRQVGLQEQQLGLAKQREGLSYKEQQAALADQKKSLANQAARLGISGTQLQQQLQNGLTQLGISQQVSLGDLAQAIVDRSNGVFTPLGGVLDQISAQQGLPALGTGLSTAGGG